MNILLVDDHQLFRDGLQYLLPALDANVVIHQAGSVSQAIEACRRETFRLVLLDLGLGSTEGVGSLRAFREAVPDQAVVVLSGEDESRIVVEVLEAGALGFVPKSHSSAAMIAALQLVLAGQVYVPPSVLRAPPPAGVFARLSERQHEVAMLMLKGLPNKMIARRLEVTEGTVKAHVSSIFQIIGARSRVEAVLIAAQAGVKVL